MRLSSLLLATLLLVAAGCADTSPTGTVERFLDHLVAEDYDEAADLFAGIDEATPDERAKLVMLLQMGLGGEIEGKDGLRSYAVASEQIDGDEAQVCVEMVYGNGDTDRPCHDLVREDGAWRLTMDK